MAIPLQCLLRLPSCLRRQALQEAILSRQPSFSIESLARRAFTNSTRSLRQQRPAQRVARPGQPRPQQPPPAVRNPPSPPQSGSNLKPSSPKPISYVDQLFLQNDQVLLYKAPNHRSFTLTSYIFGSLLLIGGYNWGVIVASPPPDSEAKRGLPQWVLVSVSMAATLSVAVIGTAVMMAPARLIRAISVLRATEPGSGGVRAPVMRVEIRTSLPFQKPKFMDVRPSEAFLDRRVSAVDIDLTSVPLGQSEPFTASINTDANRSTAPSAGIVRRAWDTFFRDVRRMFYREGIAYMRFEGTGGAWKLDLQGCELLDDGRPLERLTKPDLQSGVGPMAWVRRAFGA